MAELALVYRRPAERCPNEPAQFAEDERLVYATAPRGVHCQPRVATLIALGVPVVAAGAMTVFATPGLEIVGLTLAATVAAVRLWKRKRMQSESITLRVNGDKLFVHGRLRQVIRLDELVDVALEYAPDAAGGDTARVLLVRRAGTIPLTERYLVRVDAIEWFGRVRSFLATHGWLLNEEQAPWVSELPIVDSLAVDEIVQTYRAAPFPAAVRSRR